MAMAMASLRTAAAAPVLLSSVSASAAFSASPTSSSSPPRASVACASSSSCLTSSFTSCSNARAVSSFKGSSFAGVALRPSVVRLPTPQRGGLVVVRAKVAIGCTKRSRSRKALARVSGFRVRMSTPTGRNVLRKRRAKGRKNLVPKSNPSSGKYA